MRRFLLLPLIIIVLLQSGGLLSAYMSYRVISRVSEIRFSDKKLEVLHLNTEQYRKSRISSSEISWKGKMYDVLRIENTADGKMLTAMADEEESEWISELEKNSHTKKHVFELLKQLNLFYSTEATNFSFLVRTSLHSFSVFKNNYFFLFSSRLFYPPKF